MPAERTLTDALPLIKHSICNRCDNLISPTECSGNVRVFPIFVGKCKNVDIRTLNEYKLYDIISDFIELLVQDTETNIERVVEYMKRDRYNIDDYIRNRDLRQVWKECIRPSINSIKQNKRSFIQIFIRNKIRKCG